MKEKTLFYAIAGGETLLFYALMVLTPLYSDDYNDVFCIGSSMRISAPQDVLAQMVHTYALKSGRMIPLLSILSFNVLAGTAFFNALNAIVFLVLLLMINKVSEATPSAHITLFLFGLFILMPGFKNALLWRCGACNYLWVAVLLLLFYRLMKKDGYVGWQLPLLFVFGIVCGWTNEALVIGFAAGCVAHYAIHRSELTHRRIVMLSGLIVGTALLVLAPGSIHRFLEGRGTASSTGIIHQMLSSLLDMDNLRLLPLLLVMLITAGLLKKINRQFFVENILWFMAIIVSFLFVLMTGHTAAHSRFGIEFFSLIVILRLCSQFAIPKSITVACGVAVTAVLALTFCYSYQNHLEYQRCVAQIKNSTTGVVETNEVRWPPFFDRLILRFMTGENSDYYQAYNGDRWIERYYGVGRLCFLPHRFLETVRRDGTAFSDFDTKTDLPFYARRMSTDEEEPNSAVLHLGETDWGAMPFFLRSIARKMGRYAAREVATNKLAVVSLPEGRFLLVTKNHMVSDRVERISLTYAEE